MHLSSTALAALLLSFVSLTTASPVSSSLSSLEKRAPCTVAADCTGKPPKNSRFVCEAGECAAVRMYCKKSLCTGPIPANSHAACRNGACDFYCNAGFHREGDVCAKDNVECTKSSQCRRSKPANSHVFCDRGQCGVTCNNGFMYSADRSSCIPNESTCGETTCDSINNGSVSCNNGECTYTCRATYRMFNSNGRQMCLNLSKDPSNCGSVGNQCPSDYAGNGGTPSCSQGQCSLKCPGSQRPQNPPDGPAFCS